MEHLPSHHILKQISAMDTLFHKNHSFVVNLKGTNFSENKVGSVPYTQMYRLMQNSTICLAESYSKWTTRVHLFTKNFAIWTVILNRIYSFNTKIPTCTICYHQQRRTFAKPKSSNVISLFQCKFVSSPFMYQKTNVLNAILYFTKTNDSL